MKLLTAIFLLFLSVFSAVEISHAQQIKREFFKPSESLNKKKLYIVTGSIVGIYGSALVLLNQYWYKGNPRSKFHFFNDGREWLGMDKGGHVYAAWFVSKWSAGLYRWAGVSRKKAAWAGGAVGFGLLSTIEVFDAFSSKWGFSGWDLLANGTGAMLMTAQELAWKEQRIIIKMSSLPQKYPDDVKSRAHELYGSTVFELFLKDYNASVFWASLNIHSFIKRENKFPEWLNVAVGYGANGMLGGFENKWCSTGNDTEYHDCAETDKVDRSDIQRYPQFYFSFDIDFSKIKTRSPVLKSLFEVINLVKFPFPALEFNPVDKVRFHPLFF